jgi:hypothetical protein
MAVTPAKNERNQHCQLKISRVSQRFASDNRTFDECLVAGQITHRQVLHLQVSVQGGVEMPCVDSFLAVPAPN